MKIFISQPMGGFTEEEINAKRAIIISKIKAKYGEGVEILDTNFHFPGKGNLYYLGESIKMLDEADGAYFAKGWQDYSGCIIERKCCEYYNIPIEDEI